MILRYWLNEDKLPPKLKAGFSSEINAEINNIDILNQSNTEALKEWHDYIDRMVRYISNPSIAFDYTNRYKTWHNGVRFIRECGYNMAYSIVNDYYTGQAYIWIFKAKLNPENFGLKVPPTLKKKDKKRTVRLTESQLRYVVRETLIRLLQL